MRFWPPRSTVGIEVMFTVPCHKCREWQHCRLQMAGNILFLADSFHSFFGQSGYFTGRQGGAISWITAAWGLVSVSQVKFLLRCVCINQFVLHHSENSCKFTDVFRSWGRRMEIHVRRVVWLSSIPCFGIIYGGTIDCGQSGVRASGVSRAPLLRCTCFAALAIFSVLHPFAVIIFGTC